MTPLSYLQKMQEIGDRATPGPWFGTRDLSTFDVSEDNDDCKRIVQIGNNYDKNYDDIEEHNDEEFSRRYNNTEFIATSRNEWNKLLEMNGVLLGALEYYGRQEFAEDQIKSCISSFKSNAVARTALDAVSKIVSGG